MNSGKGNGMPAKVMVPRTGHTPGRLRGLASRHRFRARRHRPPAIARVMEDTLSRAETAARAGIDTETPCDRVLRPKRDHAGPPGDGHCRLFPVGRGPEHPDLRCPGIEMRGPQAPFRVGDPDAHQRIRPEDRGIRRAPGVADAGRQRLALPERWMGAATVPERFIVPVTVLTALSVPDAPALIPFQAHQTSIARRNRASRTPPGSEFGMLIQHTYGRQENRKTAFGMANPANHTSGPARHRMPPSER